ncbi:ImmA/IrrE family metallo-endopeptidase [Mycobacterium frederiksbergense]|nr:ImmA/IrrE family metallo-endopeptidase [Mycolicibacterium frederiksbergense]
MPQDALSRAIRGQRGFGAAELARIADHFGADLHYLIAGVPDPHRVQVVARHDYDQATGKRSVPGRDADQPVLDDIVLAYHQAPPAPAALLLPTDVEDARTKLGPGFVRPFLDRIQEQLDVDVVRIRELSTAYSFIVESRAVIAVPAVASWFWENWCLAHELGHLVLRHHADASTHDSHERSAHAFAAELLMPAADMRAKNWDAITPAELAARVWEMGVSTAALANRLDSLRIDSPLAQEWKCCTTQKLLRHHWVSTEAGDPITKRMEDAAHRRFPVALQTSHLDLIAAGGIGKGTLAWMLGVPAESLEVEQPSAAQELSTTDLLDALGI